MNIISVWPFIDKVEGGIGNAHSSIENTPCFLQETTPTRLEMASASAACSARAAGHVLQPDEVERLSKQAITLTLTKREFLTGTSRTQSIQSVGKTLLSLSGANERVFKKFNQDLVKLLKKPLMNKVTDKCRSSSAKRARLWTAFHKLSVKDLPHLWSKLYESLQIDCKEPLFYQTVNLLVFEELLKEHFKCTFESRKDPREEILLSKDELNTLRYSCGYVALKILKKYEKSNKYPDCEMCLGNMAVQGDTTDFTTYTSEWFKKTNRGGLFPVNDETLTFFIAVEKVTRTYLPKYCSNNYENTKDVLIKVITEDIDVQFYWTLISQDIDEEEDAVRLLKEIVTLWITIRGFSQASTWLEEYLI